jgi:hypothetical protein
MDQDAVEIIVIDDAGQLISFIRPYDWRDITTRVYVTIVFRRTYAFVLRVYMCILFATREYVYILFYYFDKYMLFW